MSQQQPGLAKSLQKQIKTCVSQLCFVFFSHFLSQINHDPQDLFCDPLEGPDPWVGNPQYTKRIKTKYTLKSCNSKIQNPS